MSFILSAHALRLLFYVIKPQKKYIKLKLVLLSLLCKSRCFKTANIKFYPQILSTEASLYSKTGRSYRRYQTSPAVYNPTGSISRNCIYFLDPSPINAKLTSFSHVHASKSVVYLFLRQLYRYHSNNSYGDVHFGNSSH